MSAPSFSAAQSRLPASFAVDPFQLGIPWNPGAGPGGAGGIGGMGFSFRPPAGNVAVYGVPGQVLPTVALPMPGAVAGGTAEVAFLGLGVQGVGGSTWEGTAGGAEAGAGSGVPAKSEKGTRETAGWVEGTAAAAAQVFSAAPVVEPAPQQITVAQSEPTTAAQFVTAAATPFVPPAAAQSVVEVTQDAAALPALAPTTERVLSAEQKRANQMLSSVEGTAPPPPPPLPSLPLQQAQYQPQPLLPRLPGFNSDAAESSSSPQGDVPDACAPPSGGAPQSQALPAVWTESLAPTAVVDGAASSSLSSPPLLAPGPAASAAVAADEAATASISAPVPREAVPSSAAITVATPPCPPEQPTSLPQTSPLELDKAGSFDATVWEMMVQQWEEGNGGGIETGVGEGLGGVAGSPNATSIGAAVAWQQPPTSPNPLLSTAASVTTEAAVDAATATTVGTVRPARSAARDVSRLVGFVACRVRHIARLTAAFLSLALLCLRLAAANEITPPMMQQFQD